MKSVLSYAFFYAFSFTGSELFSQNTILWEITGNGVEKPSYLLGTLKFIGEKEFYMPAKVEEKLRECQLFAIEDQVDHHAQHELNKELHFPKKQSLATVMGPDDYKRVKSFFQAEFGIDSRTFEKKYSKMKPLAITISMTRLSLGEGVKFYDIELLKLAKQHNISAYSLEEIDREAEALNSFPMADQVGALLHSVTNFETQKSEYKNLEAAFVKGNIDDVFRYTVHPFENNEQFIDEFYSKRNEEWVPELEDMMKNQQSFIAVGVAHLEGDKGLLSLLREKGYTLKPVQLN